MIKRTLHGARRYEFYVLVARTISHSFAALTREILFLPLQHKIHVFSPPCNILHGFSTQSRSIIDRAVWKWSGNSRFPGAFPVLLVNLRCFIFLSDLFSPVPFNCPWVSEDGYRYAKTSSLYQKHLCSCIETAKNKISGFVEKMVEIDGFHKTSLKLKLQNY